MREGDDGRDVVVAVFSELTQVEGAVVDVCGTIGDLIEAFAEIAQDQRVFRADAAVEGNAAGEQAAVASEIDDELIAAPFAVEDEVAGERGVEAIDGDNIVAVAAEDFRELILRDREDHIGKRCTADLHQAVGTADIRQRDNVVRGKKHEFDLVGGDVELHQLGIELLDDERLVRVEQFDAPGGR